jgi:hypothetical protein
LDTLFLAVPVGAVIFLLSGGEWFDFTQYQHNIQSAMAGNASAALNNAPKMDTKWELLFEISVLMVIPIPTKK